MKIKLLLFGITSDLLKTSSIEIEIEKEISIALFKNILKTKFPQLTNLNSYAIAVNESYANNNLMLKENDVVAIIPPVSGG